MDAAGPWPLLVRSTSSSCSNTSTLSRLSLTSNSNMVNPWAAPTRMAARVFSGARRPPPRCAI
ncbi:Uncharacterised protein [Bordetella pertussis]|nr:Uncharacterised protein [Bordetella pertussis]